MLRPVLFVIHTLPHLDKKLTLCWHTFDQGVARGRYLHEMNVEKNKKILKYLL